jgi:iron complex outermembrane receptor protein
MSHTRSRSRLGRLATRSALQSAGAIVSLAAISTPFQQAFAQEQGAAPEEVVVTGSRIRRTDEGALPVQTITQQDIQRAGVTSPDQFLQTLAVAVQGNTNTVAASGSGVTSGGVSSASLRGLGSQRTLVLVNGRRLSGGGTITDSTSVDVNSIPLAAVERVEVLKEGASALYGSDAIAGVINFILRQDYQGAEATANFGDTSDGGAMSKVNGVVGFGNLDEDRYNAMFVASWQKEDALFGRDRGFADSSINEAAQNDGSSGNSFPANVAAADGSFTGNPLAGNCAPSVTSPLFGPDVCRYDPAPEVSLLPDSERASIYGAFRYALTDNITGFVEASYSRNEMDFVIQPVPLSDQFALPENHPLFNQDPYNGFATILLRPTSPYYPTDFVVGQTGGATPDLLVRYRSVVTGNREWTDTIEQPRATLGLEGDIGEWNFDVALMYSQTELEEVYRNGAPSYERILPLLNSGQVNFFGENSAEILELVDATQFRGEAYSTKTSISSIAASATRDLIDLPGGPLALAFGAELRQEKFETDPSVEIQSGDISSYGGNFFPIDRDRDVTSAYAELNVPVLRSLELNGAVRFDDYQGTGNKTVPKVSLRWRPNETILVRGSAGRGFRAPSLTELWQPQVTGVTAAGLNDPERCNQPDANGIINQDSRDCATQFPITLGGNPDLKPEESENYTLGVVVEPTPEFSFGVDAFRVNLEDTIIFGVSPTAILANTEQFGDLVTRGPPEPGTPGLPGRITSINQINLNFGETKVEGVDADVRVRFDAGGFGTFAAAIVGTYFTKYDIQNPDGSFESVVGEVTPVVNGSGGVVPRWHHYLTLGWSRDVWDFTITQSFQTAYDDLPGNFQDTEAPDFEAPEVGSYLTHDIQAAFSGVEHLRVALGVRNVADRDPPYTNAGGQNFFQSGYDPGYVDPRGRFYYASLTYSFEGS